MEPAAFSVDLLRSSLDASLKALGMDCVDILLLHAAPRSVLQQDDLMEALGRAVEQGKARMAGISAEPDVLVEAFHARRPQLRTAQFAVNPGNRQFADETRKAAGDGWLLVANHPFGGPDGVDACRRRIEALLDDATLGAGLRAKLDGGPQVMPEAVLNAVLHSAGVSVVLASMMKARHVQSNVRALEQCRFTPAELEELWQKLG